MINLGGLLAYARDDKSVYGRPNKRCPSVLSLEGSPFPQGFYCVIDREKTAVSSRIPLRRDGLRYGTTFRNSPLLGDGEPQASAALGLGHRAVDLVELLEDAIPLI